MASGLSRLTSGDAFISISGLDRAVGRGVVVGVVA